MSDHDDTQPTEEATTLDGVGWTRPSSSLFRVPLLTIVHHPVTTRVGERCLLASSSPGQRVAISRREPAFAHGDAAEARPLADVYLSRQPMTMAFTEAGIELTPPDGSASVDIGGQRLKAPLLVPRTALARGVTITLGNRVVLLLHEIAPLPSVTRVPGVVGDSEAVRHVLGDVQRVGDLSLPVLLRGETGVGKELVAQAIHRASPRAGRPFVSVNMGAIPPSTASSELFGHVRGAFTGAVADRPGFFERAEGGTLFLDEIGEAPADVQVMLLRALESGEIQRVGAHSTRRVDVRLLAATDVDLDLAVKAGRFRSSLHHRLSRFVVTIPPLRERRDDIGRLFIHFLREELTRLGEAWRLDPPVGAAAPWLPAALTAQLVRYSWPGNVRQLRNVASQLAIASRGAAEIRVDRAIAQLTDPVEPADSAVSEAAPQRRPSELAEEDVLAALRAHRWRVAPTAKALGISNSSLHDLIDRSSRVRKARELSAEELAQALTECGGDLDRMSEALEVSSRGLQLRLRELRLG